jgi:thiol-disulfide isomerase/thioredoxin
MGRKSRDREKANRQKEAVPSRQHNAGRLYALAGVVVAIIAAVALLIAQSNGGSSAAEGRSDTGSATTVAAGIVGNAEDLDIAASYPGKVVVVNYMAGWCQPCWGEIPGFIQVYEEYKARGLTMVGISLQTSREQTQAMIEQLDIPYPVYEDLEGSVAMNRFRLKTMPTTFVFKDGQPLYRLDGEVSAQVLRSYVEDAL